MKIQLIKSLSFQALPQKFANVSQNLARSAQPLPEDLISLKEEGITDIIIPLENQKDLVEIPKEVRNKLNFITVKHVDEVFKTAIIFKENK